MSLCANTPKDLLEIGLVNKHACEKSIKLIDRSSKKIIVTGPRCSGKSTTLLQYQEEKINSGNDAIHITIASTALSSHISDNLKKEQYELFLSLKILNYVKEYYYSVFEIKFVDLYDEIKIKEKMFYNLTYSFYNLNDKKVCNFYEGTLVKKVIDLVKQEVGMDSLTIILDRFDWVNDSNKFQDMAKFYLDIFDRYIITTDEKKVYTSNSRKQDLIGKGYDIVSVNYGKNINQTKKIVSAECEYIKNNSADFNHKYIDPKTVLDNKIYSELIGKCDGDFNLLFNTIIYFYFDGLHQEEIWNIYEEVLDYKKTLEEMTPVKKLYI